MSDKNVPLLHPAMTDDETSHLIDKMSALLTGVANALKGDPDLAAKAMGAAGMMHSWHDLPALAQKLKTELALAKTWEEAVIDAAVVHWTLDSSNASDPRKAIHDLIAQVMKEIMDPAISKPARDLHDRIAQLEAENSGLRHQLADMDQRCSRVE